MRFLREPVVLKRQDGNTVLKMANAIKYVEDIEKVV